MASLRGGGRQQHQQQHSATSYLSGGGNNRSRSTGNLHRAGSDPGAMLEKKRSFGSEQQQQQLIRLMSSHSNDGSEATYNTMTSNDHRPSPLQVARDILELRERREQSSSSSHQHQQHYQQHQQRHSSRQRGGGQRHPISPASISSANSAAQHPPSGNKSRSSTPTNKSRSTTPTNVRSQSAQRAAWSSQQQQQQVGSPSSRGSSTMRSTMHIGQQQQQRSGASPSRSTSGGSFHGTSPTTTGDVALNQASQKVHQAEQRISTLMQELDDLKFFNELESAPVPPTKPQRQSLSERYDRGIPLVVRMERPVLSPRQLAKLDRTSLELEAQELQRSVEVLESSCKSMESTVKMQEVQLSENSEHAKKIAKLESMLQGLRVTLQSQLQELHTGRETLTSEYEHKLEVLSQKYHKKSADASSFANQCNALKQEMAKMEKSHAASFQEAQQRWAQAEATSKEEASTLLKTKMEESSKELKNALTALKDAQESRQSLEQEFTAYREAQEAETVAASQKEETLEAQVQELQRQLLRSQDKVESMEESNRLLEESQMDTLQTLQALQSDNIKQSTELISLTEQMECYQTQQDEALHAAAKQQEEAHTKRLNDMVATHSDATKMYEERLGDMQKQLTLQADRHEAEMASALASHRVDCEKQVESTRLAVHSEYEPQVQRMQSDLSEWRRKYDASQAELLQYLETSESKDRDAAREFHKRDLLRQSELDKLTDKVTQMEHALEDKQQKLTVMQERLAGQEHRQRMLLKETEQQHQDELVSREDLLSQQRKLWKSNEVKLRMELAQSSAQLMELQDELELAKAAGGSNDAIKAELLALKKQHDDAARAWETTKSNQQVRISSLQQAFDTKNQEYDTAKAEWKSMQTELQSTLNTLRKELEASKTDLTVEKEARQALEKRVALGTDTLATRTTQHMEQIAQLKRELESAKARLDGEAATQDERLVELEASYANKVEMLEHEVSESRRLLAQAKEEKATISSAFESMENENREALERFTKTKDDLEKEKALLTTELSQKQQEIETTIGQYISTITEMEEQLQEKESKLQSSQTSVDKLNARLRDSLGISMSKSKDSVAFQERINELELELQAEKEDAYAKLEDLEEKLKLVEEDKSETAERLQVLLEERGQAVDALDQVIEECQSRDEELETLTILLHKREEELEHAKLIATKALASAQEIKTRYREKGGGKMQQAQQQLDDLQARIEYLTEKNERLKTKMRGMESAMRSCDEENSKLRDELQSSANLSSSSSSSSPDPFTPKSLNSNVGEGAGFFPLDNGQARGAPSSNDGPADRRRKRNKGKMSKFLQMDNSGFAATASSSSLSSGSPSSSPERRLNDSMSTNTADLGDATKWLHQFDEGPFDGRTSQQQQRQHHDDAMSEPGVPSRRSQERDALRKYVRKRYRRQQQKQEALLLNESSSSLSVNNNSSREDEQLSPTQASV